MGYGEVECPKCGLKGRAGVRRIRSTSKPYLYLVVKHQNGKVCVLKQITPDEVQLMRQLAVYSLAYEAVNALAALLSNMHLLESRLGWPGVYRLMRQVCSHLTQVRKKALNG
ncbi:MAG: hypothetical protein QXQ90_06265 [Desulfurococcaceae archaeon]